MAQYIGIISGKGGVGKTTTAINLAAALNSFGRDSIVVDANLSTPNLGLHLGIPVVPINLHHVLQKKSKINDSLYLHPSNIKVVPAGISLEELKNVNPDRLTKALEPLDREADFVIIDGAAGLGREALATINTADEIIIVTNPEIPAVTDALKTIKLCEELEKNVLGVVLARTSDETDISLSNITSMLEKPIIGIIPEDRSIREALIQKDVVVLTHPNSNAAIGYKKLAASILGEDFEEQKELGFFQRIFKRLTQP